MIREFVTTLFVRFKRTGQWARCVPGDRHELRPLPWNGRWRHRSEVNLQVLAKNITREQAAPRSSGSPTEKWEPA